MPFFCTKYRNPRFSLCTRLPAVTKVPFRKKSIPNDDDEEEEEGDESEEEEEQEEEEEEQEEEEEDHEKRRPDSLAP